MQSVGWPTRLEGVISPRTSSINARSGGPVPARRRFRRSVASVAIVAVTLAACGSNDDAVSSDDGDSVDVAETDAAESDVVAADTVADAAVSPADSAAVEAEPAALQESGPVVVDGAALDPFDSSMDDLSIGVTAPVISGESFDGSPIVIGAPSENLTLVVFLAHWCPHCNDEIPELIDLDEAGAIPDNVDVIGVSTAVRADAENFPPSEWIDDKGWAWPMMADDEGFSALNAMGGTSFPFAVVLSADGTVLARRAGQATGDETIAFLADAQALADA